MRYRLRTLLILLAVGPPVAALFWWLTTKTELFPVVPAIPVGFTIATLTAIVVIWLSELADYLDHSSVFRFRIRDLLWLTVIAVLAFGWLMHRRSYQTAILENRDLKLQQDAAVYLLSQQGIKLEMNEGKVRISGWQNDQPSAPVETTFSPATLIEP